MRTGQRKLNGSASNSTMHSAHKPLRRRQHAARLALIASILGLSVSNGIAQEKEPPRLFRGGLVQQLRSMTEKPETDSAPSNSTDSAPNMDAGESDQPTLPKPRPANDRPRASTPTESRTAKLQSQKANAQRTTNPENAAHGRFTDQAGASNPTNRTSNAASKPNPTTTQSNNPSSKSGSGSGTSVSNKSASVGQKNTRAAELGVPVTNPKLANEAKFQLSDQSSDSNSTGYSANSKYDSEKAKAAASAEETPKVFNSEPKVQAVETISQAPKVSRRPLPSNAKQAAKTPEQVDAPKKVASNTPSPSTGGSSTNSASKPTGTSTAGQPSGLRSVPSTYSLDQADTAPAPNQTATLPSEYPSLQAPTFGAPGAASQQTKPQTTASKPQPATTAGNGASPKLPPPPASLNTTDSNSAGANNTLPPVPTFADATPAPKAAAPKSAGTTNGVNPNGLPALPPPPSQFGASGNNVAPPSLTNNVPPTAAPRAMNPIRTGSNAPAADEHMTMETPRLQVLLKGPHDMPVGAPAEYQVLVRNVDDIPLDGVMLRLEIPNGVAIQPGKPTHGEMELERTPDGATLVTWSFTNLAAYQNASAPMELVAKAPRNFAVAMEWTLLPKSGEAQFEVRQARLELALEGPSEAEFGVANNYRLHVRNPGTAVAKNVKVKLGAASFGASETQIDEILPGQQQSIDVELTFNERGTIAINAEAFAAELKSASTINVLVKQALVTAAITGSERVYHGSTSVYDVKVRNTGDLDSRSVRAELAIPEGAEVLVKPEGASLVGQMLTWDIPAVKAGETINFPVELNLWTAGEHQLALACKSSHGQPSVATIATLVEAIADLKLVVNDPIAPAPVGGTVAYEMSITNRGSRAATNVRAVAQFSDGIEPVNADGSQHRIVTGQVIFDPIARIEAGETKVLRVQAKASAAGTHRFRAEVRSDENDLRLVQEETTQYLESASRMARPIDNSRVIR